MATCGLWKAVVWERKNGIGKWCPYSSEVSHVLEQSYQKGLLLVLLGDIDINLKVYSVHLKDMVQISKATGTKCGVRRHLCDDSSAIGKGLKWQWHGGHGVWHTYEADVLNFIEAAYQTGEKFVDLSKQFPSYHYELDLVQMIQRNRRSKFNRSIQRIKFMPYPIAKSADVTETETSETESSETDSTSDDDSSDTTNNEPSVVNVSSDVSPTKTGILDQVNGLWKKLKKPLSMDNKVSKKSKKMSKNSKGAKKANTTIDPAQPSNSSASSQANNSIATYALVDGKPWYHHWPPHTAPSQLKPVPGIDPLPKSKKTKSSRKKAKNDVPECVIDEFTEEVDELPATEPEENVCIICYEALSSSSTYSEDNAVVKLKLCSHMFHKACLKAMYESGPQEKYLQCPSCKKIHGEKCGVQPPGEMEYHVIPYSLPGYSECETIRIIYNIPPGIQGPDHPNPGKHYTARGFPRNCYLPDNEMGRKVLRLLVKAWERRLIFTIGRSSTTGEENTVTWNEIHHKTEFSCSKYGHGFPDPNYFENVIAELESHGITESVYNWYPA